MSRWNRMAGLLSLMAVLVLAACEQDYYDKGEGRYSLMRADFVQAHANADKQIDYIVTDDGDSLAVRESLSPRWVSTPDSIYRALLYYNKVDNAAQSISIGQIPTAFIRTADYFKDTVKTDPVKFESLWKSRNGRYLNFSLVLMVGSADDEKAVHHLGVVGDTIMQNADGTRTYHLRLYHDQGAMPEYYSQRTYFSIPLAPYDVDSMRMAIQTYDGLVVRTLGVK